MATTKPKPQTKDEVTRVATKINFKASGTDFPARPAGDYAVSFIGFLINPASASSGQPTVRLDWAELNDGNPTNKKIMKTYSLQSQALFSLKRDMIRMGADVEEMNSEDADLEDILNSLIGAQSTVVMGEPREYKDKEGNDKLGDNFKEVRDPRVLSGV